MDPVTTPHVLKGVEKLAAVVGRAVGKWYEPIHIRRIADAKAYEKLTLARAAAQAKVETKAILEIDPHSQAVAEEVPLLRRAAERVKYQEEQRQTNLEAIIDAAAAATPESVSSEPVDETWANRFFSAAADVSHEQMQAVWGKILAAEVASPGSYSLRALETLRNMSTSEAQRFQHLCTLLLVPNVVYKVGLVGGLEPYGPTFNDILVLRAAGLVADSDMLSSVLQLPSFFKYHDRILLVRDKDEQSLTRQKTVQLESFVLTPVGAELSKLVERKANWQYVQHLAQYWSSKNIWIHVVQGFESFPAGGAIWRLLEGIPPKEQVPDWKPSPDPFKSEREAP